MTVWQIAAGDGPERDYSAIFLRYGVAAVGPGDPGPYPEHVDEYTNGPAYRDFLEPFVSALDKGDLLVLKRPSSRQWEILAVGQVDSEYIWEPRLGDVEGWDLQHSRRVSWRRLRQPELVTGLVRGTLRRVQNAELQQRAHTLWEETPAGPAPQALPDLPNLVGDEDLIAMLIDHGISSATAEATADTLRRIRRLTSWYAREGFDLGEHEIRTFVVVPLLLALGWPEQRIRIEYQRADIALWNAPFSNPNARVERIVETKRAYTALGTGPLDQAARYAVSHDSCRSLIVTDGFRWKLFDRDEEEPDRWIATAYANLLELRDRHPFDPRVRGSGDLFISLLP